ncbi:MAG: hypothetical protein O7I42_26660 [Alphaproteobacteria bacterium]|nr:hypothetical protein [Alphaproteobacteria bacterium]
MRIHIQHRAQSAVLGLVLLSVGLLCLVPAEAAAKWRTTEFKIFLGYPHPYADADYQQKIAAGEDPDNPSSMFDTKPSPSVVRTAEAFLHDVALRYEHWGLPDPVAGGSIESTVDKETGREVIRVYYYDMQSVDHVRESKYGARTGRCDPGAKINRSWRRLLLISTRTTVAKGRLTAMAYQTMAHELFHAIQGAATYTKIPTRCLIGSWITEGMADAIGFDVTRAVLGDIFGHLNSITKISPAYHQVLMAKIGLSGARERRFAEYAKLYGMRNYSLPLAKPAGQNSGDDYTTSSFWRHLAELTYAKIYGGGVHLGSSPMGTDYSYLAGLMARKPQGPGRGNEIKWLAESLLQPGNIGQKLDRVYAQFISAYADYMDGRIPTIKGLSHQNRNKAWLGGSFDECREIVLDAQHPTATISQPIREMASVCMRVSIAGNPADGELAIQGYGVPEDKLAQLRAGRPGGELIGSPYLQPGLSGTILAGKHVALWRLPVNINAENVVLITNMAATAQSTKMTQPTLHFSVPAWNSNMTVAPPPPPGTTAGQRKQVKTRADVRRRAKRQRRHPSPFSAQATQAGVQRGPANPGCDPISLRLNQCGPQLVITLSLDAGVVPGLGFIGGAGGVLSSMGGTGGVSGSAEEMAWLAQRQSQIQFAEGAMISIGVPRVDYGFSGFFTNADISVSKGGVGGTYIALHPKLAENNRYAPNGEVTILEFTPYVLRGEFSANLVDSEEMKTASRQNPDLHPVKQIYGSFTVSAPWRGDGVAPDVGKDSLMMNEMKQDIISMLQNLPPAMRAQMAGRVEGFCEMGFTDEDFRALEIPASCGDIFTEELQAECACTCETAEQERLREACPQQCEQQWEQSQCFAPKVLPAGASMAETGDADEETLRFAAEMRRLGMIDMVVRANTALFQQSQPPIREMLWQSLESAKQAMDNQ